MSESRRGQLFTNKNMPYTYILKSINYPKTYTGSTVNLENRIKDHNKGFSSFSKRYRPWKLIYKKEFKNLIDARKREKYFKSAAGRRYIKKLFETSTPR